MFAQTVIIIITIYEKKKRNAENAGFSGHNIHQISRGVVEFWNNGWAKNNLLGDLPMCKANAKVAAKA